MATDASVEGLPTNNLEGHENGGQGLENVQPVVTESLAPTQPTEEPQSSAGEMESMEGAGSVEGVEGMDTQASSVGEEEDRKLFIGGLHHSTTDESLRGYFEQFGPVAVVDLKKDTYNQDPDKPPKHRGFAFVTMERSEDVEKVLAQGSHILDTKPVDCKRALAHAIYQAQKNRTKKVFVGGVPTDMGEDTLREYFGQFGEIEEVALVTEKNAPEKRRGFVFVTFTEFESVDKCTQKSFHQVGTSQVEVKRATPREDGFGPGPMGRGWRGRPYRGGMSRGGGGGGWQPYGGAAVYGGYGDPGYYGPYDGGYGGGYYGGGGGGGGRGGGGGYGSRYGPMKGSYGGANRGYHPYGR